MVGYVVGISALGTGGGTDNGGGMANNDGYVSTDQPTIPPPSFAVFPPTMMIKHHHGLSMAID